MVASATGCCLLSGTPASGNHSSNAGSEHCNSVNICHSDNYRHVCPGNSNLLLCSGDTVPLGIWPNAGDLLPSRKRGRSLHGGGDYKLSTCNPIDPPALVTPRTLHHLSAGLHPSDHNRCDGNVLRCHRSVCSNPGECTFGHLCP